jgi:hypothetical protein
VRSHIHVKTGHSRHRTRHPYRIRLIALSPIHTRIKPKSAEIRCVGVSPVMCPAAGARPGFRSGHPGTLSLMSLAARSFEYIMYT